MNERLNLIERLRGSLDTRASYIKSKLGIVVPSQIRALRLQSDMPRQSDLAKAAGLHQSRISMFETPGASNMTLETLAKLAAAFEVGLVVKFVPFSEMLRWENEYSQDTFAVTRIAEDLEFQNQEAQVQQSAIGFDFGSPIQGSVGQSQFAVNGRRLPAVSATRYPHDIVQYAVGGE